VYPTGNKKFPAIYYDLKGKMHLLHTTRVVQLVDTPDSDENAPDIGDCALSRCIGPVSREILISRYIETFLDDKPPPGFLIFGNLNKEKLEEARNQLEIDRKSDSGGEFGNVYQLFGLATEITPTVESQAFSAAPEKFDYQAYIELIVKQIALGIGLDIQDLWELTSAGLGSGTQSEVLARKSRGKAIGRLYKSLERIINMMLPDGAEFEWQYKDPEEDQEAANKTATWANTIQSLGSMGVMSTEEQRRLLANQSPEFHDVLTDDNGELRRLPDDDPKEESDPEETTGLLSEDGESAATQSPEITESDNIATGEQTTEDQTGEASAQLATPTQEVEPDLVLNGAQISSALDIVSRVVTGELPRSSGVSMLEIMFNMSKSQAERIMGEAGRTFTPTPQIEQKDFSQTASLFTSRFKRILRASGNMRVGGVRSALRSELQEAGEQAYRDGLEEGGVSFDDLDATEKADARRKIAGWVSSQSSFIDKFASEVKSAEKATDLEGRAQLWINKSLRTILWVGKADGAGNKMVKWNLGNTEKHCKTCLALNGQVHRMKDYVASGFVPGSSKLECTGINCDCFFTDTKEGTGARGRLPGSGSGVLDSLITFARRLFGR
jgi:hypothetical protein